MCLTQPYSTCCKVLGITLDLGEAKKGLALMKNTESWRHEVVAALEKLLDGERLRGRLQFASGQLFGRMARQALHQLVFRGGESKPLGSRGVWGVTCLLELLKDGLPREVSNCETVIYELEALAVVLALKTFEGALHNRCGVIFTDNSGVHGSFVHCWSDNPVGNALAHAAALKEFELHAFLYCDRLASPSNPADAPSRGDVPYLEPNVWLWRTML